MTGKSIRIGASVACSDGACGTLLRVVLDPEAGRITHVAVGPRRGEGRLVPARFLVSASQEEVTLSCTRAEFGELLSDKDQDLSSEAAAGTNGAQGDLGSALWWQAAAPNIISLNGLIPDTTPATNTFDRVPPGEEQLRPGRVVKASDGPVGHVGGLVVEGSEGHITHLLVEAGHLWGKREVAVPVSDVESYGIAIQLALTRQRVSELPRS